MLRMACCVVIAATLVACGGGGGSDGGPKKRPSGSVEGTAFDNVLINSDINVYSLAGEKLGSGTTDTNGLYSVELKEQPNQVVKIVANRGQYKEEATNKIVELEESDHLYAYVNYTQGGSITTNVTLYTTIAAGYAEHLMSLGVPARKAVENANSSISELVGVDIVNVTPVDITDPNNSKPSLDSSLRYSFFTAASSPFTAWVSRENGRTPHEFYNSIMFAQLAYDDISHDGLLNGEGAKGVISMGVVQFDESTYRNKLALNMLVAANSENNKSTIGPGELLAPATKLNNSNHVIYGQADIIPLDAEKPVVANPSWFAGETVAGEVTLSTEVSDVVGVSSVQFIVGGQAFLASNPDSPSVTINTENFEDAIYPVTVKVENFAGAITNFILDLTIANAGIAITDIHPADGEHIRGIYDFRAKVTDPIEVSAVTFKLDDNLQYTPGDLNTPIQSIDTTKVLVTEGQHDFDIVATNQGGFQDTYSGSFIIDNTAPVIDWPLVDGTYLSGNVDISATVSDNIELATAKLFWDGVEQINFVQGGNPDSLSPSHTINTLQDFEGEHSVAFEVSDKAGAVTTESKAVFLDWNPPTSNFSTPSGNTVTSAYSVTWQAHDTNGIEKQVIKKDGVHIVELGADDRTYTLAPTDTEGFKKVELTVYDKAGKTAVSAINVDEQHVPPGFGLVSQSTVDEEIAHEAYHRYRVYTITGTNFSGGETFKLESITGTSNAASWMDWFRNKTSLTMENGKAVLTFPESCEGNIEKVYTKKIRNPKIKLSVTDKHGLKSTKTYSPSGYVSGYHAVYCEEES